MSPRGKPARPVRGRKTAGGTSARAGEPRPDCPYRLLFEQSPLPAWVVDQGSPQFLAVNDAAVRRYGWTREEFLALAPDRLRPAGPVPPLLAAAAETAGRSGGLTILPGPLIHQTRDGTLLLVEIFHAPVQFENRLATLMLVNDVTDQLASRRELADRKLLLDAIINASPECIKVIARDGTLVQINRSGLEILQADSLEALCGQPVLPLVVPEDRGAFQRLAEKVFRGESGELDFAITGLKGRPRLLSTYAVPLHYPGQADPFMLAITRDITERRGAEVQLREREALYRALFENAPIGLGISDEQGNLLAFNDAMRAPGAYTAEDIRAIGNVARLYTDPGDRARALELARRDGRLDRFETRFLRKDGSSYQAMMSLSPVEVDGRRCWLAVVEDLTAQRGAEQAQHSAEERYRAFIAHSTEAIFRLELEKPLPAGSPENEQIEHLYQYCCLAECNDAMAKQYGEPVAATIVGRRLGDLLPRDNPAHEKLLRAFVRSEYRLSHFESQEGDGRGRPRVLLNTLVGMIENGQLCRIWGTQQDVTDRKLLEGQLRQAQKMEAIGRLAGGVAHDFNNLLTAMLGSVEMLLANLGPSDPRLEDASDIKAAASRAAALTRQLLAFSRRQLLRPELLDLNVVVNDVQRLLRRLVSEDIELVTRLSADLPPLRGDRGQLEQVIVNLVVNARDAMPHGGVVIMETAHRQLDENFARQHAGSVPGDYVSLGVHDTGEGMDAETQAHLFEPFFTTKELGKGTGLGLATVYGIVKQSGGYITVDSEPRRGTSFHLYFPVAGPAPADEAPVDLPVMDAAVATEPAPVSEPAVAGGTETILIAEDEERIRVSAKRILERYGYRVLVAADGQAALEALAEAGYRVDLVVSDVVMPRLSGPELYDALRQQGRRVRFLFTSGYAGRESRSRLLLDPAVPFLPKPWTVQELVSRVREILDHPA